MKKLSLYDLDFKDKRVLMRVDFNVPLNEDGTISDDSRIRQALPSIQYILQQGGRLILMSHLGRPKGSVNKKLTLAPCAKRLSELLEMPVELAPDCIGPEVESKVENLTPGHALLLENLRFHRAEEDPDSDPNFAQSLANLGDCYVNDAFGTAHRRHSSTATITQYFPQASAAGFLVEKEVSFLLPLVLNPKRPFYAILGGAKISTKIGVIESLLSKVDALFIGGGMAYTFFKAQNISIGQCICDDSKLDEAKKILKICEEKAIKLFLPRDNVVATAFSNEAERKIVNSKDGIGDDWMGLDIGPKTVEEWTQQLQNGATIFWNGPLGAFELPHFAEGTTAIAKFLANLEQATTIIGGGDSASAIYQTGLAKHFSHISTGGGASLEFLEFGHLPGIDALSNR